MHDEYTDLPANSGYDDRVGNPTDELSDAAERLEGSSWKEYDDRPDEPRSDRSSGFLSGDDVGRVRAIVERQLRERPLPTLLLAVAAGWLAGKVLR